MNFQLRYSKETLPVISPAQNGPGRTFEVSKVYDRYGKLIWEKSPRGFISHYQYDVATGTMIRKIEDVDSTAVVCPDGWITPDNGGLNLVTNYEIDRFGRVIRELGPVHQVQINPTDLGTTAVREVLFTLYLDEIREVRRARGYATGTWGNYTFTTVGSVVITRTTVGPSGMIEERLEAVRLSNVGTLTEAETFTERCRWRRWSFTTSDQWGKILEGRVYHRIPPTGFGDQNADYEMVEYGYDEMERLVFLKDETGTITRTVYDVRGYAVETWVGTNDTGATDQFPKPPVDPPPANNMVLVTRNVYDDGLAGGNGYLTKVIRKVNDNGNDDRIEERKYSFQGFPTEVKINDGTRDILTFYTYNNAGQVIEAFRYRDLKAEGNYLGAEFTRYDDLGRIYRTETKGATEAGVLLSEPLTAQRWYDASGNLIKETGPNTKAAVKYLYDGVERNRARYIVLEGEHPGSSGSGGGSSGSGGIPDSSGSGSDSGGFGFSSESEGSEGSSGSSGDSSGSGSSGGSGSGSSGGSGDGSSGGSGDGSSGGSGDGSSGGSDGSSGGSDGSSGGSDGSSGGSGDGSSGGSGDGSSGGSGDGSSGGSGDGSSGGSGGGSGGSGGSSGLQPSTPMCCCGDDDDSVSASPPGTNQQTCADPAPCDPGTTSPNPIRYATGELLHSTVDLQWSGFGFKWGQTRSYGNRLSSDGDGLNGYRWLSKEMSFATQDTTEKNLLAVVSGVSSTLWVNTNDYQSLFAAKQKLIPRGGKAEYEVFQPDGSSKLYYGFTEVTPEPLQGKLKSMKDRNGNVMALGYYENGLLDTVAWAAESRTAVFDYDYYTEGVGKQGRLKSITQRIDGIDLQRVGYDYYQVGDHGEAGDLKEVVVQDWKVGSSVWATIRRTIYRYYKVDEPGGFPHGLKMVIGPDGCRRLQAAGLDPFGITDAVMLGYSDFLFEYDDQRRVTMEKVHGGSQTIRYDYVENADKPPFSEVKTWAIKTTETRADGNQIVVYSNRGGKPILHMLRKVSDGAIWANYREYNDNYQTVLMASPAAVKSVAEPVGDSGDLVVELNNCSGLVRRFEYNIKGSAAEGYVKAGLAQPGKATDQAITTASYSYGTHGAGNSKVHPLTEVTRNLGNGQSAKTSNEYQFFDTEGSVGGSPGGSGGSTVAPNDISRDKIFLQETWEYDQASNTILSTRSERFHDAIGEGALQVPSATTGPKGRCTYTAYWPDVIGRTKVTADYGTNGGEAFVRALDAKAPDRSDIILVSTNQYADDGEASGAIDPLGIDTRWKSDAMGRRTELVENYHPVNTSTGYNRTTRFEYHSNSMLKRLTVVMGGMNDQETNWHYGVEDSAISSKQLLREKTMSVGGSYSYSYNRQGQAIRYTDPNNTVHTYTHDKFGRTTRDAVTLPGGSPIDGSVRAIDFSYSAKGELDTVTSLNAASGIVNRVWFKYTPFGQLSEDRQRHDSLPSSTASVVRYTYRTNTVPGSNDVRPLSVTYPGGRRIQFQYGLAGSDNELLGRIGSLRAVGESADFADYQYVGIDRFVKVSYVQPAVNLSYINPDGLNAGDAGDPYTGWDRFGRTQDMRWTKGTAILDRILYGYDRGSRRKWRDNARAPVGEDEFYDYDGLSQLVRRDRGELNLNRTAIGGVPKRQEDFTYDRIGNWDRYRFSKDGSVQLNQTRVHNRSNILTQIDGSSALLEHDLAGNMTKVPPQEDAEWSKAYVLKWDAWNRLVKVSTPTGTVVAEYAYDGITRRVLKRAGGVSTHYYYNSQWRPVEEREEAVSEVSATYDWGIRYRDDLVRRTKLLAPPNPGSSSSSGEGSSSGSGSGSSFTSGSGSAEGSSAGSPLPASSSALEASSDGTSLSAGSSGEDSFSSGSAGSIASSGSSSGSVPRSPVTHYALHDYYNVTAITDIGGAVVERYGYSAFGETRYMTPGFVDRTDSLYEWDLLFKAQFRDEETGYYNYGYRYYVPLLGRWINTDPIEEEGGINLFCYAGNDAINNNDLLGLMYMPYPYPHNNGDVNEQKRRDNSCCDQDKIAEGRAELLGRANHQISRNKEDGIRQDEPRPEEGGHGAWSCDNLNTALFENLGAPVWRPNMNPQEQKEFRDNKGIPECWDCKMENRGMPSKKKGWLGQTIYYDHWVVICTATDKEGKVADSMSFDAWDSSAIQGQNPNDGFRKTYPKYLGEKRPPQVYQQCGGGVVTR